MNPQTKRGATSKEQEPTPSLTIDVDGERVYVKLTEGVSMPLLGFRESHSNVSLSKNGKSYIMLTRDDADHIDLDYQTNGSGEHQLKVSINNASLSYLHLIDRLTGNDIDLIAQPTYQFHSGANDYTGRFKLCFGKDTENANDLFAYISDGQLIINGEGTLQIFDVLGHQLLTKELSTSNCQLPTVAGVYVLRLITPEKIKTQQIVIPN